MTTSPWILRTHPRAHPEFRLFCFPFAGGGASLFRTWSAQLPDHVEVCGLQPPGRESRMREAPLTRLNDVVSGALEAMTPLLDKPFALYGHSLGALMAFETAHRLRTENGDGPSHLFVSARRAPDLPDNSPPIHALSQSQFMDALRRRYAGIPEVIFNDKGMRDLFFPVLRADMEVLETYQFERREPLHCKISAFGGLSDRHASSAEMAAWSTHTDGEFAHHTLPGGHFFVRDSPQRMLEIIRAAL